ncbi:MAG: AAA family ATPase [Lachnospiraceae bacterium]|nr:AAA family ATPase [Lachnospiraceae bacterium]
MSKSSGKCNQMDLDFITKRRLMKAIKEINDNPEYYFGDIKDHIAKYNAEEGAEEDAARFAEDEIPDDNLINIFRFRSEEYMRRLAGTDIKESDEYLINKIRELRSDNSPDKENLRFYDLLRTIEKDLDDDPEKMIPIAKQLLPWISEEVNTFMEDNEDPERKKPVYRDCVACLGIIDSMLESISDKEHFRICEPAEMKAYLDEYVIGQDSAKRILATAVYGHCKRVKNRRKRFLPDSVLMIGPSGCGKTELVRRLAGLTDCPFVAADVSSLSVGQVGRGRKKESLLADLYREAGCDLEKAQGGIIFMDEFDKLLVPSFDNKGIDTHAEVQGQLLTMIEGGQFEVEVDSDTRKMFDTSRILFILAGAFQGLEEFIRDSKKKKNIASAIGFSASLTKEMDVSVSAENVTNEVLIDFGMKRELAGRIGSVAVLDPLGREELKRILTEPKDCILERYARELRLYNGGSLVLKDDTIDEIIDRTMEYGVGARGLDIVLRKILTEVLFEAPDMKYVSRVIMKKTENGIEPVYIHKVPESFLKELGG